MLVTGVVLRVPVLLTDCAAGAVASVTQHWPPVQRQEYALGHPEYLRGDRDRATRLTAGTAAT